MTLKDVIDSGTGKASRLDGLPYKVYKSIPDLLGQLLAEVYINWKQNGFNPRSVRWGVVTLVRRDPNKGDAK